MWALHLDNGWRIVLAEGETGIPGYIGLHGDGRQTGTYLTPEAVKRAVDRGLLAGYVPPQASDLLNGLPRVRTFLPRATWFEA